ncbi:MAG: ketol-acid reductoisomerase [Phycisphaerales bacterium]|nr:ketol-acid reductoisomerase [Planctomycetota bacterium]MBL6997583.1 ketol-acid reductoisomerase [Phycisphaerales bacterium]
MCANHFQILKNEDVPLDGLAGKSVSIIGYGNQGKAHALNLRDSGLDVVIGARNPDKAREDGFTVRSIADSSSSELVIIALPDEIQKNIYTKDIAPNLIQGATLGFIHGFAIHFGQIDPPAGIGVVMVAPKGPGITVRQKYLEGSGVLTLLAVERENSTQTARELALGWAAGIGSSRLGVLESTFKNETETDLFGEQSIIVGGLATLIQASYETLVDGGYPPELAYIECCHEVKQVADIIHERGIAEMMKAISNTAEMGAYEAMDLLDDEHLRNKLRTLLNNVQDGSFAKRLVKNEIHNKREELRNHEIEKVGKEIRSVMHQDDD